MFRSLNSRLLLSYIAVILVCLALVGLGLFLFVRASPLWTGVAFLRLEAAASAALPAIQRAGQLGPPADILTQVAEEQEIRTLLVDTAGMIILDSEGDWDGKQLRHTDIRLIDQSRARGIFTAPGGGRWAFVSRKLPTPDGGHQTVLFISPQSRLLMLAWFAENLLPPLVQAGVVALVLSVLLALLISRSVAAPLRRVAGAAESLALGQVGTRAPLSGPTEVQSLARSFNTMADRVEAAQRSQRDLVANVSHELKTPLTSIQGFSQALLDGTARTPEAVERAARIVHEEAERMRRMVDELLVLARFDAGQMALAHERVELGPLLRGCVEKFAPQAQEAGVRVELDVTEGLSVTGDGDRLAQVFANLLDNSVAHTPAGGRVTVTAQRGAGVSEAEVVVSDTGAGIPPAALPRVFERFYQVDESRGQGRGAGLGLAISKEIVEAHGGSIAVESVVGLGTRFTVRLPCSDTQATSCTSAR